MGWNEGGAPIVINEPPPAPKPVASRRRRGTPLIEEEAELCIRGRAYPLVLKCYGKRHRYFPGQSGGRGERRLSPPEPAHADLDCVVIGNEHYEVEIDAVLPEEALDALAELAMEAES